jgi:hypothetical protein
MTSVGWALIQYSWSLQQRLGHRHTHTHTHTHTNKHTDYMEMQGEASIHKPKRQTSKGTKPANLDLTSSPQAGEEIHFCCLTTQPSLHSPSQGRH